MDQNHLKRIFRGNPENREQTTEVAQKKLKALEKARATKALNLEKKAAEKQGTTEDTNQD